jgi:hypothetical protein
LIFNENIAAWREGEKMSNRGWIITTLLMLTLGVYFIAYHHPRDEAAGLTISNETEGPSRNPEK